MNAPAGTLQKVRSSMMNAVHDLPLIVARDEGFFRDEGLDVEILKTPAPASTHPITGRCAMISSHARLRRPMKMVSAISFACANGGS